MNLATACLHDTFTHKHAEFTSHYFKARISLAPIPTHGCMTGIKSEYPFPAVITDSCVVLIYNLLKLESIIKIEYDLVLTHLGVQKETGMKPFASTNVYTQNVRR